MIRGFFKGLNERGVSPIIAIVLLLMMTVAAAGAAYFWLTRMQSGIQEQSTKSIENIMQKSGRRLIAQAAICEPTAPEGMVGWWEFYEGEGNKTHDSSRNENTGTINGANWTPGKIGKALEFDGSNDWVDTDLTTGDITGNNGELTYAAWMKGSSTDEWDIIVGTRRGCDYALTNEGGNGNAAILFNDGSNKRAVSNIQIYDGEWHYVVGTYTGSTAILYVDGTKVASNTGNGDLTSCNTISIGAEYSGAARYHNGPIDEVRIFDRALSQEEINKTYRGKMKVKMTVRNIGSVSIPEAEFVANLKKDGTTVDSDTYVTESSIDTGDLKTLTFYFNEMRPGGEYTVSIPGIDISQSVKCQSLE